MSELKHFEVKMNDKEIQNKLLEYSKTAGDLKPALRIARRILLNAINDNFESEGVASGEKWDEWSDGYYKVREKLGKADGKILQLSGDLVRSINSRITNDSLIIGTAKEYAAAQNFGYSPRNLHSREFMKINDWTKEKILGEVSYDLMKRFN